MKIRNGFVSNSSSSSFVVLGYSMTREQLTAIGVPDDFYGQKFPHGIGIMYDNDDNYIVGKVIADVSSEGDYLASMSIDLDTLIADGVKVREHLKMEATPKLLLGTRSC